MEHFVSFIKHLITTTTIPLTVAACSYLPYSSSNETTAGVVPESCIKFIRNMQLNTIIQTNETDNLRAIWKSYLARLSPQTSLPDNNYDIISAWLDVADIHLLEKQTDRITIVIIGTQLGWRYDKTPLFNTIFKSYDPQKDSLLAVTQSINNIAWEYYIEQWPHKEPYPLTQNNPISTKTAWDICKDRCDILTAITQDTLEGPNIHLDVTNMDGHPWVTLFGTPLSCHGEEDRIIHINDTAVTAHFYCPQPNLVAADFPDKATRTFIIENIRNSRPIIINDITPAVIPTQGGEQALSILGIKPLH